jgi:hypothetical protein
MGYISTHTIEDIFHRLFKEKGRASRIEVIKNKVEHEQARSASGGLTHPDGIRGIVHEAGLAFDLFCYDRIPKGLVYPEAWRLHLEDALEIEEESWFSSDDGDVFEEKGDKAAAERVLAAGQVDLPPWHGKSPDEIAGNHDWTICLKFFAACQYFDDLDRLIEEIDLWPNGISTTFIANSCFTEDEPPLGGFDL